jgi:hypothetical protein
MRDVRISAVAKQRRRRRVIGQVELDAERPARAN